MGIAAGPVGSEPVDPEFKDIVGMVEVEAMIFVDGGRQRV